MAFDIAFDYRFADGAFFSDEVRNVLKAAAAVWEGRIGEDFDPVPAGVSFTVRDPGAAGSFAPVELDTVIDDLRIFVGAHTPPFGIGGDDSRALARARVDGQDVEGDVFAARVDDNFRRNGPVTDFEPFAGSIAFNPDADWGVDPDAPVPGRLDLFTTALHEIGHVLGLGTAPIFRERVGPDGFDGPNAAAANGGAPVPMTDAGHHPAASTDTLMAPTLAKGVRTLPQTLDTAMLADIGYAVDGFTATGSTPPVVTDGDDPLVRGTDVADTLDARGGADHVQGRAGADTLNGGPGEDTLLGQAGADSLRGGPGGDTLIGGDGPDALAGGAGADLLLGKAGPDTLAGGPGADILDGGAGADTLRGGAGADIFVLGDGAGGTRIADFDGRRDTLLVDPAFGARSGVGVAAQVRAAGDGERILDLGDGAPVTFDAAGPIESDAVRVGRREAGDTLASAPVAVDDTVTVAPGAAVTFDPLANDRDPDGGTLAMTATSRPVRGELTHTDGDRLRFTAPEDFDGRVTLSYGVADGQIGADTATVTLHAPAAPAARESDPAALTDLAPGAQVAALYLGFLGRAPDAGGLDFWRGEIAEARAAGRAPGRVLDDIAESIRMSSEAQARMPALAADTGGATPEPTPGDVLDTLYETAFGRTPQAEAAAYWGGRLADRMDDGTAVGDLVVDILAGARNGADHADADVLHNRVEVALAVSGRDTGAGQSGADLAAIDAGRDSVELALLGIDGANDPLDG